MGPLRPTFIGPWRWPLGQKVSCREISSVWPAVYERYLTVCQASLASMRQRAACRQPGSVRPGSSCGGARAKDLNPGVAASARRARGLRGSAQLNIRQGIYPVLHWNRVTRTKRSFMANLTITVPEEVLKSARRRALELGTSVNAILRDYLSQFSGVQSAHAKVGQRILELSKSATTGRGKSKWTREDLHQR